MRILFSCVGKRGYIVEYFREALGSDLFALGTGITEWTPGFVACDDHELLPPIVDETYLPSVVDVCRRREIDLVLTLSDPDAARLSTIRDELLQMGTLPLLPGPVAAARCFDKLETYRFARSRGFATPETTTDVDEARERFAFPVIVKPRFGSGSADLFRVADPDQLATFVSYAPDMMVQELVSGVEVNADVLADSDGKPRRISLWRKHASRSGETEHAESISDPDIEAFVMAFLADFGLIGPADLDLILTDEGPCLIEVNSRFGGGYPTSHLAGADYPRQIIALARREPLPPAPVLRAGVVMMKELHILSGQSAADGTVRLVR